MASASCKRSRAILRLCRGSAGSLSSAWCRRTCSCQYARCWELTAKLRQLAQVEGSRRTGLGALVLPRQALWSWR